MRFDLGPTYFFGDRWRDIGAGNKAKCVTIFIDKKYDEKLSYKPTLKIDRLNKIFSIIKD